MDLAKPEMPELAGRAGPFTSVPWAKTGLKNPPQRSQRVQIMVCHFDRSGEISYHFELWHAITASGFISSPTVIILFSTSGSPILYHAGPGSTAKGPVRPFLLHTGAPNLVYYEHYRNVRDAIARETQLKKWSRGKKVELINRLNPPWMDIGDQVFGEL
jgi:hypothetical protein